MRQVGELARPLLDFPSLSVKIPPNYRITGDLGCGRRVGPILMQQAPTPLPNCGALGLEAAGSSHTRGVDSCVLPNNGLSHCDGLWGGRSWWVLSPKSCLLPPHLPHPSGLPLLLASLSVGPCLLVTLWTVAHQAPLSMGFLRQEWNELPFPSPGDLPDLRLEPVFPPLQVDSLPLSHWEMNQPIHLVPALCLSYVVERKRELGTLSLGSLLWFRERHRER